MNVDYYGIIVGQMAEDVMCGDLVELAYDFTSGMWLGRRHFPEFPTQQATFEDLFAPYGERARIGNEYITKVISVLEEWFQRIENGTADLCLPAPGRDVTIEKAEELIQLIDQFVTDEITKNALYWKGEGVNKPDIRNNTPIDMTPDFWRLTGQSRVAFAQDIFAATKDNPPKEFSKTPPTCPMSHNCFMN